MTQNKATQGPKGGKETRGQGTSKRAQVTPERPGRGNIRAAQGKHARGPPVKVIQVKPPTERMIKLAKTLESTPPKEWEV